MFVLPLGLASPHTVHDQVAEREVHRVLRRNCMVQALSDLLRVISGTLRATSDIGEVISRLLNERTGGGLAHTAH